MRAPDLIGGVLMEMRYPLPDDAQSVIPDVSFYRKSAARPLIRKGAAPFMPEFVIEVQSPDDSVPKLHRKAANYLERGVLLVWLVHPEQRGIEIYRAGGEVDYADHDGALTLGDLLPDFSYPVRDLLGSAGQIAPPLSLRHGERGRVVLSR